MLEFRDQASSYIDVLDNISELSKKLSALRKIKANATDAIVQHMENEDLEEAEFTDIGQTLRLTKGVKRSTIKTTDWLNCVKQVDAKLAERVRDELESARTSTPSFTLKRLRK